MKTYAVVLNRDGANDLGPILKPYLYPLRAGFEDFAVLYASKVESNSPFFEATVADANGFEVILRFPHAAVRLTVESSDRTDIGFLAPS